MNLPTKPSRRTSHLPHAVALLALFAAGCGGGSSAAEDAPSSTAAPAGGPTTAAPPAGGPATAPAPGGPSVPGVPAVPGVPGMPGIPAVPGLPTSGLPEMPTSGVDAGFLGSLGIDLGHELSAVRERLATLPVTGMGGPAAAPAPSLSTYETPLPHTTQPQLSHFERALLTAYLDHPDDAVLAQFLAVHHLWQSLLRPTPPSKRGEAMEHTIIALYFLNRARDTGATSPWLEPVLEATQEAVDEVFATTEPITSDEYHDAHVFYRQAFHLNQEQDRYLALDGLLQDFAEEPNNVYTSFVLTAINLWMGGEADHDDPTTLYNFVLGSYFSLHTIDLAHQLELAWNADPQHVTRFRMAAELGGFSLLQRRWLAKLHRDEAAIALIDDEHRAWTAIQPAFHSFTLGLPFFDEPEHFMEGLGAYAAGAPFCEQVPVRTCSDLPRFSYNLLGFFLGYADFLLKAGDVENARKLLTMNQLPNLAAIWPYWDIGRDAWQHRVDNAEAIAALYANGDPSDDPINFEMKRRKWGEDTTTCQECHQTQGKPDMVAAVEAPQLLPPEQIASLTSWPAVTSAWYGAAQK
jgi:hypothetical protein